MKVSFDAFLSAARSERSNAEYLIKFRNGEPIAVRAVADLVIPLDSPANGSRPRTFSQHASERERPPSPALGSGG